jgi:virulence-associated protein VapD
MNLCIYRTPNSFRCCSSCSDTSNYCRIHTNNENYLYEIINKAIGRIDINTQQIYKLFKYIYNNDDIYTKEFIFKGCIKLLFTDNNYYKNCYNHNLYIYNLEKNHNKEIKIIYRFFMNNIIRKYKYRPDIKLNNTEDPFTLDNIDDIKNKEQLFIYQDGENNYFFIATELKYFIETNGSWNPYTKKEFGPILINHLNYFIKKFKLENKKPKNKYEWNSVQQAFTDVSQIIEKIGFYNDPSWLLKLTSRQIKGIIKTFKLAARNNSESENYFNNITDNNIFYDFAREIIKLFETGNDNFILCCNFIKSIALYNDDFYNNIPEWMSDIEMPIQPTVITIPINNVVFNSAEILYLLMNNDE